MSSSAKKEVISYKRDPNGHLMCHLCDFRPRPTPAHPCGNPSTLHYHLKKNHSSEPSFTCKHCGNTFLHKIALETHLASRHPQPNQVIEMFACDHPGCEYESLTRGNLEIHKARKHYADIASKALQIVERDSTKLYHCLCCSTDYKSSSAFHYHIAKQITNHRDQILD